MCIDYRRFSGRCCIHPKCYRNSYRLCPLPLGGWNGLVEHVSAHGLPRIGRQSIVLANVVVWKICEKEISGCIYEDGEETVCCQGCMINLEGGTC
jgi:hypothetical protein